MKRLLRTAFFVICFFGALQSAMAIVVPFSDSSAMPSKQSGEATVKLMGPDVMAFLEMTPRRYYELTGEKMKLKERIALRMYQQQLKREIRHGNTNLAMQPGDLKSGKFNFLWFLIGLILIPIGVLLAFLLTKDAGARKSALYGAAIGLVIWVFIIVL